jgi:predicted transcriptional regulator
MGTLTLRLDEQLERDLALLADAQRRSKSDLVRQLLRRQIALQRFVSARSAFKRRGQAAGVLTDDDVFDLVS